MENITKYCKFCNKEKNISLFTENWESEDKHSCVCKECSEERKKKNYEKKFNTVDTIYKTAVTLDSNPELSKFKPRELIEELKKRGYTGELKYTYTIKL